MMYCAACDRWEHDQIAVEISFRRHCCGPLMVPGDEDGHDCDHLIDDVGPKDRKP